MAAPIKAHLTRSIEQLAGANIAINAEPVSKSSSATFTRRGAMSELHLEADISRRLAPQAASAPWASDEIASQCLATNFVAWSLTSAKSPPTRVRHRARSGSPLRLAGDPRCRLMLPAKRTNAQSAFAVLQADNLNTAAIRSGPSCSSWIASDKRTYLSDFAEMLAPAEKKRLSAEIEISRGGATRFKNIGDNSPQTRRHSRLARESLTDGLNP